MPRKTALGRFGENAPGAAYVDGYGVDLRITFGERFRHARQKAGLTQREIEARTGIKQTYVSEIESGKQNPTLGTMVALAVAVGTDVRSLLRPEPQHGAPKTALPSA